MMRKVMRTSFVLGVILANMAGPAFAVTTVAITTPPNGITTPALPAININGTGSPNGRIVSGQVSWKSPTATIYTIIDNLQQTTVANAKWNTSAVNSGNVYTAKGSYKFYVNAHNAQLTDFATATNTCTIP